MMKTSFFVAAALSFATGSACAHSWKAGAGDKEALRQHILDEWLHTHGKEVSGEIKPVQVASTAALLNIAAAAVSNAASAPAQAKAFQSFPQLELKWDKDFLFVGSNGMPDHPMMMGITAWQQQVPLPQSYFGDNAWRIPLHPVPAKTPATIEGHFLRGAIALAANGIPIFNPQNNRGEVSFEIGELDEWGGHCGRADDYHYHIAPLKLQELVGKGMPIAYALDGYPIYGLTEPDGMPLGKLDECHGHEDAKWGYHYHASTKRPYLQSAFHGEVVEADGQVDPQPRAQPVRPDTPPLRGAVITGFEKAGTNGYQLTYKVGTEKRGIHYTIQSGGSYVFEFDNGSEGIVKQTYTARGGGGGGGPERRSKIKPAPPQPPAQETQPPSIATSEMMDLNGDGFLSAQEYAESAKRQFAKSNKAGSLADAMSKARAAFAALDRNRDGKLEKEEMPAAEKAAASASGSFVLLSSEVEDGGNLPMDYTGDGSGATLPLEWKGAPAGTKSFAIIMDHLAPGNEIKGYWNVWDIPANVTSLPKNMKGIGKVGAGFRGEVGYEPPKSKGPGAKTYVLHVYALSSPPRIKEPPSAVNREVLLAAIKNDILASADLHVVYSRGETSEASPKAGTPPPSPSAKEGQRRPWMQMHGAELDADHDGIVTFQEISADMDKAVSLYDANKDGVITPPEIEMAGDIREGAAFAGFIYRHAVDLDVNNDSRLTRDEFSATAKYIFNTADQDHDGKITTAEVQSSPAAVFPMVSSAAPEGAKMPPRPAKGGADNKGLIKPAMSDTLKVNVYADNWFVLYINGKLTAVDSIDFMPHNVVTVDILPEYPMTIAVMAKDNADPKTGMEYGDHIGDGGFIIKFADGTVSNASWKARSFFKGPLNRDTKNAKVEHTPIPENWFAVDFDDSKWSQATEYTEERVNPKEPYYNADFSGARFIWTEDLDLDNTIIFRTKIEKAGWKARWNTKPDLDVRGAPFK